MAEQWQPQDDDDAYEEPAWVPGDEAGADAAALTPDGPLAGAGFDWDAVLFHEEFDPPTRDAPIEQAVSATVLEPLLQHMLASLRREHRRVARGRADDAIEVAMAQSLIARRMRAVADLLAWTRTQRAGRCMIGLYPADRATMDDLHAERRLRESAGAAEFPAVFDEPIPGVSPWSDDAQWSEEPLPDDECGSGGE